MILTEEEHLAHYGILRRSGRYPWGSGGSQNTRNRSFLDALDMLRKDGLSDTEIARGWGITTTELRAANSVAVAQQRQQKQLTAMRLKEKGWSNVKIAERMQINESSVRSLLASHEKDKASILHTTANMLKDEVAKKGMIDVGAGVEHQLGVTKSRFDTAVAMLREMGYAVHNIQVQQLGTGKYTKMKVLAKPGTSLQEVQRNRGQIKQVQNRSVDYGRSYVKPQPPISIDSKRIRVNYKEDGGAENDGVIYVRPGPKKLSMGANRYGQVRIAVDGTHYLKGMAVLKEDLPPGVDIVVNSNKSRSVGKKGVMKEMSNDPDLPFGAIVRQITGPDGKVTSAMNMVNEEGAWEKWSRTLSSQVLSKQDPSLAKSQLDVTLERRTKELAEITSLTNPTVRKDLLLKFADSTDAAAVHLKAANLPRQANKVILPVSSMKPNEIYAPTFKDGERVALIRFPHGGTFEIPQLTVNNRNREARKLIGTATKGDAVGINHQVAHRLSGADFDGDTVLVIPNKKGLIKSSDPLEGLKDFDPQVYKLPDDSPIPRISSRRKQQEMGLVSNLITDMTIKGASSDQIARAVRHSMVVIDSEKHNLDFRQSEKDNGIAALREEYQGKKRGGAATLISRKKGGPRVPEFAPRAQSRGGPIDPATGRRVFEPTGRQVKVLKKEVDPVTGRVRKVPTGETKPALMKVSRLAVTEDAFSLIDAPGTRMEVLYAEHSNRLKAMANAARREALRTKAAPYSPSAAKVYSKEVSSLNHKLRKAESNAPYERQAHLLGNVEVSQKRQANPDMEPEEITKIRQQALNTMRNRTGAKKDRIIITQDEWNAIQAGALSPSKLEKILNNSDMDTVQHLALPKHAPKMTSSKLARAQRMLATGYTQAEVAEALGVGLTTLKVSLAE